jgi:hypothetical protein
MLPETRQTLVAYYPAADSSTEAGLRLLSSLATPD